mmetsp:Transcript_1263/g.4801  ORF Transcript_1263/g.4801 Transcript_1263/m.4801 type:complete len:222 (+) Transcript_1263:636-1301(+)
MPNLRSRSFVADISLDCLPVPSSNNPSNNPSWCWSCRPSFRSRCRETSPFWGVRSPTSSFSKVDLPHPFGPTNTTRDLSCMEKRRFLNSTNGLLGLPVTRSSSSIGSLISYHASSTAIVGRSSPDAGKVNETSYSLGLASKPPGEPFESSSAESFLDFAFPPPASFSTFFTAASPELPCCFNCFNVFCCSSYSFFSSLNRSGAAARNRHTSQCFCCVRRFL